MSPLGASTVKTPYWPSVSSPLSMIVKSWSKTIDFSPSPLAR